MRILVISDTHGNEQGLLQAVEEQPNARAVIHLGDGAREAQAAADRFPGLPFYLVRGNCDWASTSAGLLYAREETFAGKRIFFTHGHLYEVKFDLYRAAGAARERQADVLLFGHTHRAEITWDDGLLLFNPGSLSGGADSTYGTLDITPAGIVPNILRLRR